MKHQFRVIVCKNKSTYDDVIVSCQFICQYNNVGAVKKVECQKSITACDCIHRKSILPVLLREKGFNAYLISAYVYTMKRSSIYRRSAVLKLVHFLEKSCKQLDSVEPVILIKLRTPHDQFIDYRWNEILTRMAREREEIDHAMSWLSTLGGAFSSLGDKFDRCAKLAGKISVEQFKLAMRLGDPQLVARCKLYAALSLLQQGHLKAARNMVRKIFQFAVNNKDVRLQRMCQGVWAKLRYSYHQRKQRVK